MLRALCLLGLVLSASAARADLRAGVFDPPYAAPEFALPGSDGAPVSLARFRGKVVVLAFGFSSCPKICPTTLAVLASARRALGPDAARVQVVYVTVDPERDDAARMRAYLAAFDPQFVGATGSEAQLAAVRAAYGATARRIPMGESYAYTHSTSVYLIDRAGKLRALMPYGHAADDYVHDLRILLGS